MPSTTNKSELKNHVDLLTQALTHELWTQLASSLQFFMPDSFDIQIDSLTEFILYQKSHNESFMSFYSLCQKTWTTLLNSYLTPWIPQERQSFYPTLFTKLVLFTYEWLKRVNKFNFKLNENKRDDTPFQIECLHGLLWAQCSGMVLNEKAVKLAAALIRIAEDVFSFTLAILVLIQQKQKKPWVTSVFQEACNVIEINTQEQLQQLVTMVHCTAAYIDPAVELNHLKRLESRLANSKFSNQISILVELVEALSKPSDSNTVLSCPSSTKNNSHVTSLSHLSGLPWFQEISELLHSGQVHQSHFNDLFLKLVSRYQETMTKQHSWQWMYFTLGFYQWIEALDNTETCQLLSLAWKQEKCKKEEALGFLNEYCALLITYRISKFSSPCSNPSCLQLLFYVTNVILNTFCNQAEMDPHSMTYWMETYIACYYELLTLPSFKSELENDMCHLFKTIVIDWLKKDIPLNKIHLEQLLFILIQKKEFKTLIELTFWIERTCDNLTPEIWEKWAAHIIRAKSPSAVQLTFAQCVLQSYIKICLDAETSELNERIAIWFQILIKCALVRNESVALQFLQQLPEILEIIHFPKENVLWLIQATWNTAMELLNLKNNSALKWGQVALDIAKVCNTECYEMLLAQYNGMDKDLVETQDMNLDQCDRMEHD